MKDQITQVAELFDRKKYKKALLILNKINKKKPTYDSIHYTAACYFFERKYVQATLYYLKALKLTADNSQKIDILSNLAIIQVKLGDEDKAMEYFIEVLAIDGSVATANHRDNLCRLAAAKQHHQIIIEYAPKLLSLHKYAKSGLYFLLQSHLLTPDNEENIQRYLKKLTGEISSFDSDHANAFFELVISSKNPNYINPVSHVVEKKFGHEKWFKQLKAQQNTDNQGSANLSNIPEQRVVSANKALVASIEKLLSYSESLGAKFHPNLRIIEDNGALCVRVFEQTTDSEKLIEIPYKGLPLTRDFDIALDAKGHLIATPVAKPMNPDAIKTMALLQDIYNATDKINLWKQSFPFIALSDHTELLEKLCWAKPKINKIHYFLHLLQTQQIDRLVIDSFLGSREMLFKQQELKDCGITSTHDEETGLLSIIDFLNHKTSSNRYQAHNGVLSVSGPADSETHELFVHYNNYDPLLTYLLYGFVNLQASFIFSIPTELTRLNGQKIEVLGATYNLSKEQIPDELSHLRDYLPETLSRSNGDVQISKLMIPNTEDSHLLREVLGIALNSLNTEGTYLGSAALEKEVIHLEKQIIAGNMAYWQAVKNQLESTKTQSSGDNSAAFADVEQLIGFFTSHLQKYSAKFAICMF